MAEQSGSITKHVTHRRRLLHIDIIWREYSFFALDSALKDQCCDSLHIIIASNTGCYCSYRLYVVYRLYKIQDSNT